MNAIAPIHAVSGKGVYFAQDGLGRIKIGVTIDVAARLASLRTGNSTELTLIRFIEGAGHKVEKWLHRRFKADRIQGEWFHFSDEMMTVSVPDEAPSIPRITVRRDIRLTLKERIKEADEHSDLMGLTDQQRLLIFVQKANAEEASAICDAIRAYVKASA